MMKSMYGLMMFALAMSGMPALALAEEVDVDSDASVQVTAQGVQVSADASANGESENRAQIRTRGWDNDEDFELELEDDEGSAVSLDDLKQRIQNRKHELDDEEASTTPPTRDVMKNANPVRLAVHSLLVSKDLLGGIGAQVSEIAKQMNVSVASPTGAEMKIQSRGFLSRLFFGGDEMSAEVIAKAAEKNQQRIDTLTALLAEANISADVPVVLEAQIAALKEAQARLKALADREKSAWGLFSWRF